MTSFFIPRGLRVREADSNPSVIASELVFPNATLSAAGSVVTVQGLVAGPSSATDNAVARFDATTGKLLQNSDVIITDDGFVGIGTASPDRKLVIDGSTGSPGLSVRHTARSGGGLDISAGNNRSSIFNSDALPLRLGVESTTAINISSTNEVTFPVGVALGTPLSGVATNLTGTASGLTAGTVTTNANLTGHVTSVGNAAVLGSFTKAQLDAAVSDGNVLYVGDVTSNATHTGDVTGDTALTIANDAVTYAKMQNVSAASLLIGRGSAAGAGDPQEITLGSGLTMSGTTLAGSDVGRLELLTFKIDTTATGAKSLFFRVPYACTITGWELVANTSGSVVIDIWKDTYINYPPTVGDTITASAKPTLTAASKANSTTLTAWTTALAAGDYIEVNVDSVTTITNVTLTLTVTRT